MKKVFKKIKKNLDIFNLGFSSTIYFLVLFFTVPFLYFIDIFSLPSIKQFELVKSEAIIFAVLGFLSLAVGCFIGFKLFKNINSCFLKRDWKNRNILPVFLIIFLLGLFLKLTRILGGGYFHASWNINLIPESIYSLVGLFTWLGPIALAISYIWYYKLRRAGKDYKLWQYIAYGTLGVEMLYALPTCSKLTIVIPIFIVLIVRWYLWKRSYKFLVLSGIIIFLIFPYTRVCENADSFYNFSKFFNSDSNIENVVKFSTHNFTSRIGQLLIFSKTVEADFPKKYGKDYINLFISLGPPRFIWKDKPTITVNGNEFGKKIGSISQNNDSTSVGPTVLGDFYVNFGVIGIIFGMFILGLFFSLLYSIFIRGPTIALSGVMIYSVTWIHFIKGIENWFIPILAGYIKILVIMLVIHWFLTKQFKT